MIFSCGIFSFSLMSEMELNLLAKFFVLNNEYELLCKMYYLLIKQLQNLERQKVSLTTTILFDGQFECLTEKTIKKMTIKENEFILEMRTSLDSLFKVLAKMQDLLLESIKKARKTTRTLEPFDISILEVCAWLEQQVFGYKKDYINKQSLAYENEFANEYIDHKQQITIKERIKLYNLFKIKYPSL
jgi:hypothetical protein